MLATLTILLYSLNCIECNLPTCTQRLEYAGVAQQANTKLKNCSYVKELYPICGESMTVMYTEKPPYVVAPQPGDDGIPAGLLPDILGLD